MKMRRVGAHSPFLAPLLTPLLLAGCGARTELLVDRSSDAGSIPDALAEADVAEAGFDGFSPPGVQLAASEITTCFLKDNVARCWGDNQYGELGDGTTVNRARPARVIGLRGPAVELSPTNGSTYARLADGTVESWGTNVHGELGNGQMSTTPTLTPEVIPGLAGAVALTRPALSVHMCALLADQTVECWGNDPSAEGSVIGMNQPSPIAVAALSGASGFTTGPGFMCALFLDGSVQCAGNNGLGQLGNPDLQGLVEFTPIAGLPSAVAIAAGHFHSCVVLADRTAMCFGTNQHGELGRGTTGQYETAPAPVQQLSNVRSIAPAEAHTCALLFDGTVKCWGDNEYGELAAGMMDTHNHAVPAPVAGLAGVVQLAAGGSHTCALQANGRVLCWGGNASGELGDGTTTDRAVPTEVAW